MSKKFKTSLIIIAIIFIIVLSWWLFNLKNQKQATLSTSQGTSGATPPETPGQLPVETKIPNYSIKVDNVDDTNQIKAAFQKYINQNPDDFPSYKREGISMDNPVIGKTSQLADLSSFLSSVGANINPEIKALVGSNYYGLFYCLDKNEQKDFGLALDIGGGTTNDLQKEKSGAKESMKKWEPYMLKDLHSILFPSENVSESDLNDPLVFKDGEFRYTDVNVSGRIKSIDYDIKTDEGNYVNRIYITTSPECLKKALNNLFDY